MKILLADLKGSRGVVSKDTIAGGYGSRLLPFSQVTSVYAWFRKSFRDLPSIQMGYLAAILARQGHDVRFTTEKVENCDTAVILSSLVDYRRETEWADRMRQLGARVGFIGIAASKLPHLFEEHADFIIQGEPESAIRALAGGVRLAGLVDSPAVENLDDLPFPRWELLREASTALRPWTSVFGQRQAFPVFASRGCPEFCAYCPHRILAAYRTRTVSNIADELEQLCKLDPRPYVVFRDPLFTEHRDHCIQLSHEVLRRKLDVRFECETRLDCLDEDLLDRMVSAGLSAITFGVESVSAETLRRAGRRPIPDAHQREIVRACARRGVQTRGFYVLGFLQDTWESIAATIEYSTVLGSSFAQFKLLTPYPGTPLFKQLAPRIYEQDWEKFDGFTPTFEHPNLTAEEMRFLLGAAYTRFYMRPSFLTGYLAVQNERLLALAEGLDRRAFEKHRVREIALMSRAVTC